jgi:tripartite motif-containing protein 71
VSRRTAALAVLLAAGLAAGPGAPPARAAEAAEPTATQIFLEPLTSFWQHLEEGNFSGPRGVAYDRKHDEVWVADTLNQRLAVFTPDGLPLYTSTPGAQVVEPTRIAVEPDGKLLVLDNDRSRIAELDWRGHWIGPLELPGLPEKPSIGAIELDDEGNLYVGEDTLGEIIVYGPDRQVRQRFGRRGWDRGEFQSIADIAVDEKHIVVIDHQVLAVQVFDRHGNFLHGFGEHQMGIENFSLPEAAVFDAKGRLVIVDALRHEIKLFTVEGRFLDRFGGLGTRPGQVAFPSDVATDGRDRIYVAERGGGRVQVFRELERPAPPRKGRPARRTRPSP